MEGTDIFPTKFHDNSWLYIPNQRLKGEILELQALPKTTYTTGFLPHY